METKTLYALIDPDGNIRVTSSNREDLEEKARLCADERGGTWTVMLDSDYWDELLSGPSKTYRSTHMDNLIERARNLIERAHNFNVQFLQDRVAYENSQVAHWTEVYENEKGKGAENAVVVRGIKRIIRRHREALLEAKENLARLS